MAVFKFFKCTLSALMLMLASLASAEVINPPGQTDWVSSKKFLKISDDISMAYVEWGEPEGAPVILVHGYSDNSRAFSGVAPYLKGKHFYAIDMRGHGDTTAPTCCYYLSDFAEDIRAFIEALGYDQVALVGHSLGSMTAGVMASIHPQKVSKLVLISSALKTNKGVSEWLLERVNSLSYPIDPNSDFIQKEWAYNPGDFDEAMMQPLRTEEAAMPKRAWVGIAKALQIVDWTVASSHITAPTLIMWGDQDELMQRTEFEELKAAFPEASAIEYKGLGHSMYWQAPKRSAADILRFLNQ